MTTDALHSLLDAMWQDYLKINPDARRIHQLFAERNDTIVNDHIALRTFDLPKVNIRALSAPFVRAGYKPKGEYFFPTKKLFAEHFEHPDDPTLPKIFISELHVDQLSESASEMIHQFVSQIPDERVGQDDFCYSGRHWTLSFDTYRQLLDESEYAAWLSAFGYRPNHFTIFVNALQSHHSIDQVNDFLLEQGFQLNASGGLVKGSPDEFLEQSSTLANLIEVPFSDRTVQIPGCYYEFAQRYVLPDGHLYQGFVAASADRIFESTDVKGTGGHDH